MALRSGLYVSVFGFAAIGLTACAPTAAVNTPVSAASAPLVSVQTLVGSTPAILKTDFGPPTLRRVDGEAQVWLYHSDVCGLNLILYPDRAGIPRVAAAVPDNNDPVRCMESLQHAATDAALPATSS